MLQAPYSVTSAHEQQHMSKYGDMAGNGNRGKISPWRVKVVYLISLSASMALALNPPPFGNGVFRSCDMKPLDEVNGPLL